MNTTEKALIVVAILGVLAVAGLALFVAIKAHLHHVTLAAEVANQKGKLASVESNVVAQVKTEVAAVKADIAAKI